MKKINRLELIIWILYVLPFAITLVALPFLPDRVPIHWNVAGVADGWAAPAGTLFGPLIGFGVCLLLKFLPRFDPKQKNYKKFGKAYDFFRLATALYVLILQAAVLISAFYPGWFDISRVITFCLGALLCVVGNYMPQFRHNYFIGIRTPWTLASEVCWRRTHRFAGSLWFWCGLIYMLCPLLLAGKMLFYLTIALVVTLGGIPSIYSYFIYKGEPKD